MKTGADFITLFLLIECVVGAFLESNILCVARLMRFRGSENACKYDVERISHENALHIRFREL